MENVNRPQMTTTNFILTAAVINNIRVINKMDAW